MSAVLATFVDIKTVRTRSIVQLILEIPIETADVALKALGGVPQPATERWVGVALAPKERSQEPFKTKRAWADLTPMEQSGIRCDDHEFWQFLNSGRFPFIIGRHEADVAEVVREICEVSSRKELNTDSKAAARWKALDAQFLEWQVTKRYEDSRTR